MSTFKPIAVNKAGVTLPYKEGQYIVATQAFSDGANTYQPGVYVDMLNARQQLTMTGPQGIQGPKGDKGEQGLQGVQGEQGIPGVTPTIDVVHVDTLSPGDNATVENIGTDENVRLVFGIPKGDKGEQGIQGGAGPAGPQGAQGPQGNQGIQGQQGIQGPQGIKGEQGPAGEDGRSFEIVAHVDSADALPTASSLYLGKAYSVGTSLPNDIYICLEQDGALGWYNEGPIQGPKGDKGEQGIQGIQGEQGIQGVQGEQGVQGLQGARGYTGGINLVIEVIAKRSETMCTAKILWRAPDVMDMPASNYVVLIGKVSDALSNYFTEGDIVWFRYTDPVSSTSSDWGVSYVDNNKLTNIKGETGPAGKDGVDGKQLYCHFITITQSYPTREINIILNVINSEKTPYTASNILGLNMMGKASGHYYNKTNSLCGIIEAILVNVNGITINGWYTNNTGFTLQLGTAFESVSDSVTTL